MKNIILSGSNGQLGQIIQEYFHNLKLSEKGYVLVALDHAQLDITNLEEIKAAFIKYKPVYFINAAAYTAVDKAEEDANQAEQINAVGPELISTLCSTYNCFLVHISTDFVFGKSNFGLPFSEDDTPDPLNVYGRTKWLGEEAIKNSDANYLIIRVSWLYSRVGNNFFNTMKRLLNERPELSIVDDQLGSPTLADDLAQFILQGIAEQIFTGKDLIHFSNLGIASWYDFAFEIAEALGFSEKIKPCKSINYIQKAKRPYYSKLDTEKLSKYNYQNRHWKAALKSIL